MKILKHITLLLLGFILVTSLLSLFYSADHAPKQVPLSEISGLINQEKIENLTIGATDIRAKMSGSGEVLAAKVGPNTEVTEFFKNSGVELDKLKKVRIEYSSPSVAGAVWSTIFQFALPLIVVTLLFYFLMRQLQGTSNRALSFGQSQVKLSDERKNRVRFSDVAGAKEAKEELREIVDFLKSPQKFLALGAKIPKGVLLLGSPGVGKTLLARAVAGEANVPFFHMSGSEFVEMFVGVGASRVRDLFKKAKKHAPCIVFVDEIDAVGRQRGAGLGGGHDEREQTLNQILVEMDGFETDTNVIVMAATNRPDVLDPALLRPGRFDRQVVLDLPDVHDREDILKIHAKNKPLAADVNFRRVAARTPGFSGADLMNLMNEAAILAARRGKKQIADDEMKESIEKVLLGPQRSSHILSPRDKEVTAYHEAGHALVGSVMPEGDPVHKVSIISRGRAGGYTISVPDDDKKLMTRQAFFDQIAMTMGGYAAEKLVYGEMTTGASSDLKKATSLARRLIMSYGMSDELGPVALGEQHDMVFLGREISEQRNYSEAVAKQIDDEVARIMRSGLERATEVLSRYRTYLNTIAERLVAEETIEQEQFEEIVRDIIPATKRRSVTHDTPPAAPGMDGALPIPA